VPTRRAVLVGAGLSLVAPPARAAPFSYKEWRFDTSALPNPPNAALTRSLEAQIDIVDALPLRPDVLRFFRGFDVKVDPATLGKAALYRSDRERGRAGPSNHPRRASRRGATIHRIYLSTQPMPPDSPVFLRMLLLAYLDRRVEDGWDNERVAGWLEDAKRTGVFSGRSEAMSTLGFAGRTEMMNSPEEFFANGVGAVLHGTWPVEPFERRKIRDKLPAFYDWIVHEFLTDGIALP
jgi:hypothetical protein